MKRREFMKTGAVAFSFTAAGGWAFDFVPDDDVGNVYNHCIPFRKTPRDIREVVPGFLWADAADFQTYGGWALDTQHVGFMGSSYLLAHGTSRAVEDATLKLIKVRPGTYRLWVRSRNWLPEHSPGTFGVNVNGRDLGRTFGAQKAVGWTWQDGGVHELAGDVTMALQDKTGLFGRCSSVMLTRDLDYTPPIGVEAFTRERARLSGVSDAIKNGQAYDVIVVGAGPAGGPAALAAARLGARTALISDRPVLGGNASVEIGVPVQGAASKHRGKPVRETGIIEEIGRTEFVDAARAKQTRHPAISRALEQMTAAEPLLDVYDNSWLEGARTQGTQIRSVIIRDTLTGARQALSGRMFIDCSGDAWLGHHAGAHERVGREAKSEYNEEDAPPKADGITMSGCLRGASRNCTENFFYRTSMHRTPQPFTPPPWVYEFPEGWENRRGSRDRLLSIAKRGTWWLEHPGEVDDLRDPEFARDELIRVCYSFWNHMKNTWSGRDQLANFALAYLPFMVGKREGRRLLGDYVMTANDALEAKTFEDVIAHTGWSLDVHHPDGILSTEGPNGPNRKIPIGQIPYRCLYSRNVANLLMAGRCASVTHEALGTVRIEASCAVTGQAAGTAAALALHHRTTPRGLYQTHMEELQQLLLRNDQFVPGVRNQDPLDLARGARITASSRRESTVLNDGGRWFELGPARGEIFQWTAGEHLRSVHLCLASKTSQDVVLHIREAATPEDLSAKTDVATVTQRLPAGTSGWVEFAVDARVASPYALVFLESNPAVQWQAGKERPGAHRFYGREEKWTPVPGTHMSLRLKPEPVPTAAPVTVTFEPENILNGMARPWIDDSSNTWESDPEQALPQWIELTLREPTAVGMVQCIFDTDLTVAMPKQRGNPFTKECVRDYTIECHVDGAWKRVAQIRGNFHRLRRHTFPHVLTDRIRLTVEATHGAQTARIFEIRVYADAKPLLGNA